MSHDEEYITDAEKGFLDQLNGLPDEALENWIRAHYTGVPHTPKSPFVVSNDPMDIPEKTLKLLNNLYSINLDVSLLYRFENALVNLFGEEADHRFINPGLIFRYTYLFTNIVPRGNARQRLAEVLLPVLSRRKWIDLRAGSRNLHYDALDLLIMLWKKEGSPFQDKSSIGEFLISNLMVEKSARFCNIALNYFGETRKIGSFFTALDRSFDMLPAENIRSLIDQVLLFYLKYPALSFGYLADWLSSKQFGKRETEEKLMHFYKNEPLFSLIADRWKEGLQEYQTVNRAEGRYLVALLVLIMARSVPEKLGPDLILLFLQNERFDNVYKTLLHELKHKVKEDSRMEVAAWLNDRSIEQPEYQRVHVGTLISLASVVGTVDDFALEGAPPVPLQINIQEYPQHSFSIINTNKKLLRMTAEKDISEREVLTDEVPASFHWWQVIDQCLYQVTA